jgi:hypothetical protein
LPQTYQGGAWILTTDESGKFAKQKNTALSLRDIVMHHSIKAYYTIENFRGQIINKTKKPGYAPTVRYATSTVR